jgi:hypothetical protein
MGPGVMIYIPNFIKIVSGIQKFMGWGGGIHRHADSKVSHNPNYIFFQNEESRLKMD